MITPIEYLPIDDIVQSLDRYVVAHIQPGGFLTAVLENNFKEAFNRADYHNLHNMHLIARYVYNHVPTCCYGSPEKVDKWLSQVSI